MHSISQIKQILKKQRLSISRHRGQNFLVDYRAKEKMLEAIKPSAQDTILEIGPGLGALTEDLSILAGQVIGIEKDKGLFRVLSQALKKCQNLKLIHQDFLKFDLAGFFNKEIKVVGNLPYYISTPIITALLEKQRSIIKEIFITVQHEVGKRLVADVGSKDYSSLSVCVQYYAAPEILFSLAKKAFYPQPRVDSVFVHLRLLKTPSVAVNDQEQFFKIVRASFGQRRKTILNSLAHKFKKAQKTQIQKLLLEAGLDPALRPEQLSLDSFARIEKIFFKNGIIIE